MAKRHGLYLAILLLSIMLFLTACGEKKSESLPSKATSTVPKAQCTSDVDCNTVLAKTLTICDSAVCDAGICRKIAIENCCGNKIKEAMENNKTGNSCTCPADYGACNGTLKFVDATKKTIESKYIALSCSRSDICEGSYLTELQKTVEFFNSFTGQGFTYYIYVNYENPFIHKENKLRLEFKLNDLDPKTVHPEIIIKEIRVMEGSNILARVDFTKTFTKVGQYQKLDISLSGYDQIYPEEAKSLIISFDYEYKPLKKTTDSDGDVEYEIQDTERRSYQTTIKDKVTLVDKDIIMP